MKRLALALCLLVAACSPFWKREARTLADETLKCVMSKIDLPNDQIALECGVADAERLVMDMVLAEERQQAGKAAAASYDLGAQDQLAADKAAVSRMRCILVDGGAR